MSYFLFEEGTNISSYIGWKESYRDLQNIARRSLALIPISKVYNFVYRHDNLWRQETIWTVYCAVISRYAIAFDHLFTPQSNCVPSRRNIVKWKDKNLKSNHVKVILYRGITQPWFVRWRNYSKSSNCLWSLYSNIRQY